MEKIEEADRSQELRDIIKFKPTTTNYVLSHMLTPQLVELLKNTANSPKRVCWIFSKGKYKKLRMSNLMEFICESKVYKIELTKNFCKTIIKDLVKIKFDQLQILNLQTNWITSVEALQFLQAPNLKWLNLKQNEITEVKSLRKVPFPLIRTVKLDLNLYLANFTELGNYSRHLRCVARELIKSHEHGFFAPAIKLYFKKLIVIFPQQKGRDQ